MKYFNLDKYKKIRKRLRNNMTKAEVVLWGYLKNKRLLGHKFRRQQGAGGYVVDFYCPEKRLAIELDGDIHFREDVIKNDKEKKSI